MSKVPKAYSRIYDDTKFRIYSPTVPLVRGFSILVLLVIVCQSNSKAFQMPEPRSHNRLYEGTSRAVVFTSACLCHQIRSPLSEPSGHPPVCQKLCGSDFSTVFTWPRMTRPNFSSNRTAQNVCY